MIQNSRILIVDDEPRLCGSIEIMLNAQGYMTKKCSNGRDCLTLLMSDEFDLVLLDVFMEGMDGFQVIENIINNKIDLPVIIMTGNASTESAVKALRMGADDYLKKPFEPEELYTSVRNILSHKALEKRLKESDKRYKALVNIIPQGVQVTDLDGKITFSNPAHHKIQGTPNGKLIGKYIWDLIARKEDKIKAKKYYNFLISKQPKPEPYFTVDKTKDGRLIYTQINWDYIRDSKETLNGIISIISDITERKQAEKGREKILKALQEALENVKTLNGLLPICAHCKKIRDDKGYWNQIEKYIQRHSYAKFSHSLCPECSDTLYGEEDWYRKLKGEK